jgi:ribosomal protein S18 acetylase RimI-like enzyme
VKYQLKNGKTVEVRLLESSDGEKLFEYFDLHFSNESKSRFGPHPFDKSTIDSICQNRNDDIKRYIAIDTEENVIAYMLIKQGVIEWDEKRYAERNQFYDHSSSVTFAPSVADDWQSSGLGTLMNSIMEADLRQQGTRYIILWGGVQASNVKAINFYKKLGYKNIASFWHNETDNYDMTKEL